MEVNDETPQAMIRQLRLQAKNALAQVESQAQHFDLAERLFREMLEENPWFLPALQGLGHQQMQLGKIAEAVALFERIRQIDPAKGYS
jgi:tetratricopeptide (TPR) repeat protein